MDYQEFGLSKNEGKVYETLVKFGKLGAGEASQKSGVSYSKIYDVLASLINKELVNLIPEKSKKFVPSNPEALIKLIEGKEEELRKAKEKAREMKSFYDIKEKNPVEMATGQGGFAKLVKEMQSKRYDYSIKWNSDTKEEWMNNVARKIKSGVDLKFLTRYDKETEKNVEKWFKINKNIRKIENNGIAIEIVDDEKVMIGLIKSNVTLLIKNKDFAKVMKDLFLVYYHQARRIEKE